MNALTSCSDERRIDTGTVHEEKSEAKCPVFPTILGIIPRCYGGSPLCPGTALLRRASVEIGPCRPDLAPDWLRNLLRSFPG